MTLIKCNYYRRGNANLNHYARSECVFWVKKWSNYYHLHVCTFGKTEAQPFALPQIEWRILVNKN